MSLSAEEFRAELAAAMPLVRNFAIRLTKNVGEAEDLMQETAMRALEKEGVYVHQGKFPGWLSTSMFHCHLNRQRTARIRMHDDFDDHAEKFVAESASEVILTLNRVLAWTDGGLSPKQAEAIALDVAGDSYAEIAEKQQVKIGTIKSRLNRAHTSLRSRFGEI